MRIATITGVAPGCFEVRVYEISHAARPLSSALKSFGEISPSAFSISGSRHLCGTPRWRHFLREASLTPRRSANLSIKDQSSFVMTTIVRDGLSLSQETIRPQIARDNLSYHPGMGEDEDQTDSKYLEALLALTRALRESRGPRWTQQRMADHIGTTLAKYKKYERRTPMPHRLIVRFCETVGVSTDDYLSLNVHVEAQRVVRRSRT